MMASKATMRRSMILGALALSSLGLVATVSAAGQEKVTVCHVDGSGEIHAISIADPAFDSHMAHGDFAPGDPVPGMDGSVYDDDCAPLVVDRGELLAVAYTDVVDDGGQYDPAVDLLIAAVIDGPDANGYPTEGDLFVVGDWPEDFPVDSPRRDFIVSTNPMTAGEVIVHSPVDGDLSLVFSTATGERVQFTRRTSPIGSVVEFLSFLPAGGTAGTDNTFLGDTIADEFDSPDWISDPSIGNLFQDDVVDNVHIDFEWYFDPSTPPPPPPPPPPR